MKRVIYFIIFIELLLFTILLSPKFAFCIDIDSLMVEKDKPFNESDCFKMTFYQRRGAVPCLNYRFPDIIKITKEDLFNKIKNDVKNDSSLTESNLVFDHDFIKIKGEDYYTDDVFASILVNSYGYENLNLRFAYDAFEAFNEFTELLANYYEEKRKNPNATPDEIIKKIKKWDSGEIKGFSHWSAVSNYRREPWLEIVHQIGTMLITFGKDYDKFLESIVPIYNQKRDEEDRKKELKIAELKEEQKRKEKEKIISSQRQEAEKIKAERIKKNKLKAKLKKYNVQYYLTGRELITNPFKYQGQIVAVPLIFIRMLSKSEGVFGILDASGYPTEDIVVSKLPVDLFGNKFDYALLIVKVKGTTGVVNKIGAKFDAPYLEYIANVTSE